MDSFELNKIMGALLGCCLVLLSLNIAAGAIFAPHKPAKPGYDIAVPETPAGGAPAGPAEPEKPIAELLASSDVAKGEQSAKKCAACHTFDKGGPAKAGPNLYGIVGNHAAHMEGFKYSAAMEGEETKGMQWTFEELDHFLENPKAEVPGTAMAFAGLKKPDERANVIAYLRTLSDSPVPLPEAPAAAPAEGAAAAPAEGAAPAAPAEGAAPAAPAAGAAPTQGATPPAGDAAAPTPAPEAAPPAAAAPATPPAAETAPQAPAPVH
jgi:cytochrome c